MGSEGGRSGCCQLWAVGGGGVEQGRGRPRGPGEGAERALETPRWPSCVPPSFLPFLAGVGPSSRHPKPGGTSRLEERQRPRGLKRGSAGSTRGGGGAHRGGTWVPIAPAFPKATATLSVKCRPGEPASLSSRPKRVRAPAHPPTPARVAGAPSPGYRRPVFPSPRARASLCPALSEMSVCDWDQAPDALFSPLKEPVISEAEILLLKTIESNSSEIGAPH